MARRAFIVSLLALALAWGVIAGKKPDRTSCRADGECTSGYCECASACRSGCCAKRPKEPVMCASDCRDMQCGPTSPP
jgi:hypothetical protein